MISYFLKYFNIHKYIVNIYKHIELRYHDIEKFMTVSKNDIAVLLKFGILQSPNGNIAQKYLTALVLSAVIGDKVFCAHGGLSPFISRSAISKKTAYLKLALYPILSGSTQTKIMDGWNQTLK